MCITHVTYMPALTNESENPQKALRSRSHLKVQIDLVNVLLKLAQVFA